MAYTAKTPFWNFVEEQRHAHARGEALLIATESAFISGDRPFGGWRLRCGHLIWSPDSDLVGAIVAHKEAYDELE